MIKRVALVSAHDFARNGGVTEHVRQLARQLRRRDIDVTILAPCSDPDLHEPGLISLGGVMPIPVNGSVARVTLSPTVIEEVSALFSRARFDVVHLHEPLAPMLPLSVLNASSSPNVGTFHASGERSLGYAVSRKLLAWLIQRLSVRIAVSPAAARFAQQYFPGDYLIIPNGVDTNHFNPSVAPLPQWRDGRPTLLFVGRFEEPRKGFDVLLQALPYVQRVRPDTRLLVVGRGDAQPFQERIAALGLREVIFVGPVAAEELPRYYRSADVFCAPSTGQESFGIILIEAMSSGCPVVAADIEGYRQVVTHRQDGVLVPPQHPEALAVALLQLLGDERLRARLARAGVHTARRYDWSDISERVLEAYERACAAAAPSATFRVPDLPVPTALERIALPGRMALALPVAQGGSVAALLETQGASSMFPEAFEARVRALTQRIVGRVLGRSGISPNLLTIIGVLLTLSVTVTLALGYLAWGGLLVLLTSLFDMLDGALARATQRNSTFGAFLDSTMDRYAEALIFLGLLIYYQRIPGSYYELIFVYLAIVGSLMVSYTRARAEALGLDCKVGILARPERVILLSFGLIVGWLHVVLAILALFTNVTALQRIYHVWIQTEGVAREHLPKPARRSWFASRDQSPS
ncbi:glycosyltransferase [Kallotenue papyrolyticum]|uniref:glycosyltransferase n=1 Tax=Kallotenue papyrolyticum TaxID=1325125 RepID=UPI0004785353|nr:glycosyltransferase [Kallotenue papyrolyticum]